MFYLAVLFQRAVLQWFFLSLSLFFFSLIIFTLQKIIANYFVNNFFRLCDDSDGIRVVPLLAGGKLWFSLWILSDSAWIWLTPLLLMFLLVLGLRCHSSRLLHYEDSLSSCYIFGTPFYDSVSLLITPFYPFLKQYFFFRSLLIILPRMYLHSSSQSTVLLLSCSSFPFNWYVKIMLIHGVLCDVLMHMYTV